ncbi:MAG: DUF2207 domain-containing protein, partial [Bacilli bacterium]|nr:DUF2207 domain-containing protein [Bacilli bacterium]
MKKVLVFLISFFLCLSNTYALGKIENVNTTVTIDSKGDATVVEKWEVNKQDVKFFEKTFYDVENVTISDVKVDDANKSEYRSVDKWDDDIPFTYYLKDSGKTKRILFSTNGQKNTFTITYKVKGMISSFTDAVGINWYFLTKTGKHSIGILNITIKGPIEFSENNAALYVIGNDIAPSFKNGTIQLFGSNLTNNHQIKVMTTFTDMKFDNTTKVDTTFTEAYEKAKNGSTLIEDIRMYVTDEVIKIVLIVIGIVIVLVIALKIYNALRVHDEYYCIDTVNNKTIPKIDEVDYFENIPCNGDLYKMAFIAGYFKILKNRSDLVGALILKMVFENRATIVVDKNKPYIKFGNNQYFERRLDSDLYDILIQSSNFNVVDNSKLIRYSSEHYMRVMAWFNMGHNESINDEYSKGNIKRIKKVKQVHLVLQDSIIEDGIKILGVKKYLLNFNQVPRKTELTSEGYKYLLIMAELLGIGDLVGKEILRKNPDNAMAKTLLDIQKVKYIYKNMYSAA